MDSAIIITGNFSFKDFKKSIIERIGYKKNTTLCKVDCKCGKVYKINTEKDYKETVCECGQNILIFKRFIK